MRIGQNPAKFVKEVAKPARVTVAVLNYIPFIEGYYAELPRVLAASLDSLRAGACDVDFDLLVFDNGSCDEVKQWLIKEQAEGRIQFLILSEKNLGKGGAWNIMLDGAPGEIISYADNDCLYYPNWLSESIRLLETFPNVGMVTARPFRSQPACLTKTVEWAKDCDEVVFTIGQLLPFETFREFDLSLGQTDEEIRAHYDNSEDYQMTYKGVTAFAGASHWQFTSYKKTLQQFLPFQMDRPMGQVKQLDQRMNDAGFLRLMPMKPYVMNLSNTLDSAAAQQTFSEKKKKSRWVNFPPLRKVLLSIYNKIFKIYYDER